MSIIYLLIGLAAGGGGIYAFFHMQGAKRLQKIQAENEKEVARLEKHLKDLELKSATIETKIREKILDAKNKAFDIINEAKQDETERRKQLEKQEQRLMSKEDLLEKKVSENEQIREGFAKKLEAIKMEEEKLEALYKEQEAVLSKITNMTTDEAREILLKNVERDYQSEIVEHYKKMESGIKEDAAKKAKNIITQAVQKIASDVTSESTQTIVQLPGDEIKGRIIGREGRNINAFEHLTGVDVIVDDTPGAIVISAFDPVRRQIAKVALEKLIADGRIQPARIEDTVEKAKEEISEKIKEAGEAAVYDTGVAGLDQKLVRILGRLSFRTSYGQNVLLHSLEVAHLAATIASEVGADANLAKKAGLLHDIGKAVTHEVQGSHVEIGKMILQKFNVSEEVIKTMQAHHEEYPYESVEAVIVQVADQISGARPGARKDTLEAYLKRLGELEKVANSFEGVEKSYAIQAGREIRVFVYPEKITDLEARKLARQIADKVQQELNYPGEIKVNVIRELRVTEYAR